MNRIHLVGRKNHGKTTLMVELIAELAGRGVRVGSIKHSSHAHELDTPGTDSHRHRAAGAAPAAIVARDLIGLYVPWTPGKDAYALLEPLYADCDLVLVEGDLAGPGGIKIEVWRRGAGGHCLAAEHPQIRAVVSDDPLDVAVPVWPRRDIVALATQVLHWSARL